MTTNRNLLAGLVLAVALAGVACGGGDGDTAAPTTTASPSTTTRAADATESDDDCALPSTGVTELVVDAGGAERDVRVYVPTDVDGTSELPLVLNFHGFGSNGPQQARFSGYEELAEDEGFVVVHPTAVPGSTGEGPNFWELADLDDPQKDDVAFTDQLLDLLIADFCVDEDRVYATGMSNGGMFASRLVCDLADRIAAAVAVAAIAYSDSCDPSRSVPFRAIHGTEDATVPFDADTTGTRFEGQPFTDVLFSEPIPDQFARFADTMGCDAGGRRVEESTDVVVTTYTGCDDDVPLAFYEVVGGGHAWPGSPLAEPGSPSAEQLFELQGYTTFDIDATGDSWTFFEQHSLDG